MAPFKSPCHARLSAALPAAWLAALPAALSAALSAALAAALCACAADPAPQAAPATTSLWFAALTGNGCGATTNGQKQLPAEVETLVAVWTANADGKGGDKKTATVSIARSKLAAGTWEIKEIPVTASLDLDVYGCSKDKKIVYIGRNAGLKVSEGTSAPARVFLAPTDKLACTGSPTGKAKIGVARGLAGAAALPGGDAVIVGGIDKWDKTAGSGEGSKATDYYDARLGHFIGGPSLSVGRILPHVHAISTQDKAQLLVVGGMLTAARKSTLDKYVVSTLVPDKLVDVTPTADKRSELLEFAGGVGTVKPVNAAVDVGVGAAVLSSSIRLDKAILFVGGVAETGQILSKATRLTNPEDIAVGGTGKTESVVLNAARVRPALLSFADGTAVVWGGAVLPGNKPGTAKEMGELVSASSAASEQLTVSGPSALTDDPNLATIGPVVAPVARTADVLTFLVAGGMPVNSLLNAKPAQAYLVTVTKSTKTAELRKVSLPGDAMPRAGLFGTGFALEGRRALIGGGLVGLAVADDMAALCPNADKNKDDCALADAVLVRVPATLPAGDTVPLELLGTFNFGGPRIGVAAASLPLGALLAGGMASTRSGDTADVLDDVGEVLTVVPGQADPAVICK